jgi:hypothetical protein
MHSKFLFGKPEGKGPLGRPRVAGTNNIKTALKEIEFEDVDLSHLDKDWDHCRAFWRR